MLPPLIRRPGRSKSGEPRSKERGFTMALVALSIAMIVSMAALSIDIGTLYEAKTEAQRAADAAALTAPRVIAIPGITGSNGTDWGQICGAAGTATQAATSIAQQNLIGGTAAGTVSVNYGAGPGAATNTSCAGIANFAVNPVVTVSVQRTNLPVFFARIFSLFGSTYSGTTVSATATAEAFNPSASDTVGTSGNVIPVQPRCVKPWIIPNMDPATTAPVKTFVTLANASITNPGISPPGVIGENFNIAADCQRGRANCSGGNMLANPPTTSAGTVVEYIPALVQGTPVGVPSCSNANPFQEAIGGCDQTTNYACGTLLGTQADLTENPINPGDRTGDTGTATDCLIHSTGGGEDQLNAGTFPFQIQAGSDNPLVQSGIVTGGSNITASSSIVTIPVYDSTVGALVGTQPQVTVVGFLQVFIKDIAGANVNVYVLNVAACGNGQTTPVGPNPVTGTSPVPIRLITPP